MLFSLLLAAVMLLALTACGGGGETQTDDADGGETGAETAGSNELTVYTAFPEAEVAYYFNAFEEATGIKVNAFTPSRSKIFDTSIYLLLHVTNISRKIRKILCL